jgi:hypothetical protein
MPVPFIQQTLFTRHIIIFRIPKQGGNYHMDFYGQIKEKMCRLVSERGSDSEKISISTKALSPEEAIGKTGRKDFPLLTGKEVLMNASFRGSIGQAFTDQPSLFYGSIGEVMNLDLAKNNNRAIFIATINAILKHLGLIAETVHCKNEEPEICAGRIRDWLLERYRGKKIALVGLQPAILDQLKSSFQIRVLDLNPDNIGTEKNGVLIEDGEKAREEVLNWADVILATGSMAVNGTILDYLDLGKPVYFFGTTVAGVAYLQKLDRLCFCAG